MFFDIQSNINFVILGCRSIISQYQCHLTTIIGPRAIECTGTLPTAVVEGGWQQWYFRGVAAVMLRGGGNGDVEGVAAVILERGWQR